MRAFPVGVCPGLTGFRQNPQISSIRGLLLLQRESRTVGVIGDGWRTSSLNGGGTVRGGAIGLERQSSAGGAWQGEEAENEAIHGEGSRQQR
jgi:hypothetical protein